MRTLALACACLLHAVDKKLPLSHSTVQGPRRLSGFRLDPIAREVQVSFVLVVGQLARLPRFFKPLAKHRVDVCCKNPAWHAIPSDAQTAVVNDSADLMAHDSFHARPRGCEFMHLLVQMQPLRASAPKLKEPCRQTRTRSRGRCSPATSAGTGPRRRGRSGPSPVSICRYLFKERKKDVSKSNHELGSTDLHSPTPPR